MAAIRLGRIITGVVVGGQEMDDLIFHHPLGGLRGRGHLNSKTPSFLDLREQPRKKLWICIGAQEPVFMFRTSIECKANIAPASLQRLH